jgi:ribose transport system substrate-binding protein
VGRLNPDILNHFYASKCFISCSGFSLDQGLTELYVDEAVPKSHMIRLAREVITLIDHSKFGRIDTYRFAELNQIHHLVVDEAMAAEHLGALRELGEFPITVVGRAGAQTLPPRHSRQKQRRYRIGFGNLSEKMLFAQQVRRSLERAVAREGAVELLLRDNALDRQTALENAEWFVAQEVDLLIEYQIDAQAGNVIMDRLNRAGIPVIAVDIPLPGAAFFGADNYRAGWMAGQELGNWVKANWAGKIDKLIKLEAFRVGPGPGARVQGVQEGLEAVIGPLDPEQVIDIDSPVLVDESTPLISQILPDLPADARIAIAGINDEAVLGALAAFERSDRLHQVAAVGQNADRLGRAALRRPNFPFIGSTSYAPEKYGEQLLALALKILRGEAVPPASFVQHTVITKENIDEHYPLEEDGKVLELGVIHHEPIS